MGNASNRGNFMSTVQEKAEDMLFILFSSEKHVGLGQNYWRIIMKKYFLFCCLYRDAEARNCEKLLKSLHAL